MSIMSKKTIIIFVILVVLVLWNDVGYREKKTTENISLTKYSDLPENVIGFLDLIGQKAVEIKDKGFGLHSFALVEGEFICIDTLLILQRYYQKSNALLRNAIKIPDKFVGLSLKEFKEISIPWEVKKYAPGKFVVLYRSFDETASMHIGIRDGRVAIFYGKKGEENLKDVTEIMVNDLPHKVQNSIKDGLTIDSDEELLSVLDGFISSINND